MPNLQKILWVVLAFTVIVWIGVGIYYLKPLRPSQVSTTIPPKVTAIPTPQPTQVASESLDEVEFIEGNFVDWEEIEGSRDRYILLTDPQTNNSFPKIRVGFEFSSLYGYGQEDITVFWVEKKGEEHDLLWSLKYFSSEEIDRLIKKGDPIKIYLMEKIEKEEDLKKIREREARKDENGHLLAQRLLIKREEGKAQVEEELGREIQKPEIP